MFLGRFLSRRLSSVRRPVKAIATADTYDMAALAGRFKSIVPKGCAFRTREEDNVLEFQWPTSSLTTLPPIHSSFGDDIHSSSSSSSSSFSDIHSNGNDDNIDIKGDSFGEGKSEREEDTMVDVFIFDGAVVMWGASPADESLLLSELSMFESGSYAEPVEEMASFSVDPRFGNPSEVFHQKRSVIPGNKKKSNNPGNGNNQQHAMRFHPHHHHHHHPHHHVQRDDVFTLENDHILLSKAITERHRRELKLAASHALMRSVRLDVVEEDASKRIGALEKIPNELVATGRFNMSKKECLSLIGHLMALRGEANLHSGLVDPPTMCWERTDLEAMFERMVATMDVSGRLMLLNKKLDYSAELLELARLNLTENQSHRLELIIIILIAVEIIIYVLDHAFAAGFFGYPRSVKTLVVSETENPDGSIDD